jgi:hypothetical protein
MHCTNCGALLQPGETQCKSCGAPVRYNAPSYPQQASRPAQQPYPQQNPQPVSRSYPQPNAQAAPQPKPQPAAQAAPQPSPQAAPAYQQPVQPQPYVNNIYLNTESLPPQYRPLSPWAYFGLSLLFSVPVVGFVFLIVFSFSSGNINRRNYARSFWCALLIAAIIGVIVLLILLATGTLGSYAARSYY